MVGRRKVIASRHRQPISPLGAATHVSASTRVSNTWTSPVSSRDRSRPPKPVIVLCEGFDWTREELYFVLVKAANERDHTVLTYEGPRRGSVLRDQGMILTDEWEKPTAAVVDAF